MQHIRYNTGRCYDYGTTQVLTIEVPDTPQDILDTVSVRFADTVRNIRGVVQLFAFELSSSVGAAVLREYDAGRYTAI